MAKYKHRRDAQVFNKQSGKIATLAQIEQREISWVLFITEGYIANLKHARTVNSYTGSPALLEMIDVAVNTSEYQARQIREQLARSQS